MNVFDLSARILLDSNEYTKGLNSASNETKSFGSKLTSALGTAGKVAVGVMTTVASAVVALSKEFADGIKATAEYGDNIDKMSQKMGLSAEAYQEWDFIMQHAGTNIESMKASMKTLANAVDSNNDAFARLGITQEQIASMTQEQLFGEVISGLQNVEDTTERTYLAGQLLGRGATELGALLNMSAEDTEAMRQQVHDLGAVMSDEAVKASANYADSLQNLQWAVQGLSHGTFAEFLPAVVDVMDGLTAIFSGDTESGVGLITKGVDEFTEQLAETIPKVMDIGSQIVLGLIQSISTNLPKMMDSAVSTAMTFIQGLVSMLPSIIDGGVKIIISLIKGIGESLPTLIPAVVEAVLTIVQTIIDNIDLLIDGVLQFMKGFSEGITKAIPVIVKALPELIHGIVDGLLKSIPELIDATLQITMGVVEALPEIITALVEALPEIISLIIEALLENLPAIIEGLITLVFGIVEAIPQIIEALIEAIPQIIEMLITALFENFPQIILAVLECLGTLLLKIGEWFLELIGFVDEEGDGIWDDVAEWFDNLITSIVEWFAGIWESISGFFVNLWTTVTGFFSNVWGSITGFFSNIWKSISGWFSTIWTNMSTAFSTLWTNISGWFEDTWESITGFIDEAVDWGANLVKGIWQGVSDWAEWLWGKISGFFDTIWTRIKDFFGIASPSKKFAWIAEMDVKGLQKGFDQFGDDAVNTAIELSDKISDALHPEASIDFGIQNGELKSSLSMGEDLQYSLESIYDRLDNIEDTMYNAINRALVNGFDLRWNDRELTRLIKDHA